MRCAIVLVVAMPLSCTRPLPTPKAREPEPVHNGKTLSEWLEQLRTERDINRGDRVVEALAKIGKPAVPVLIAVLEDKSAQLYTRQRAAWALGGIGPDAKPAVPALTRILQEGAGNYVGTGSLLSRACARALAGIERPVYFTLLQALKDEREAVRREAAEALLVEAQAERDMKAAVPALIESLRDSSWEVRRSAAMTFEWRGAPDAKPAVSALVAALKDEYSGVRQSAARALGNVGATEKEVARALVAALKDKEEAVWKAASSSLVKIGKPAVPALIEHLKDKDACARLRSVNTLGEMGPIAELAVPALLDALKDKDEHVRIHAGEALKKIDREAARGAGIK